MTETNWHDRFGEVLLSLESPHLGADSDLDAIRPSSGIHPSTNPLRGIGAAGELHSAREPSTDAASKVGALPQTPPGAEPLDLNTYARFR
jgi:hypothetical protein